jgi:hypothetical protein
VGVIVKTHDGTTWMSRWDKAADAVFGPQQVRRLATFFGQQGVPFATWCVTRGIDPVAEAQICSEVLNSGTNTLYLDLEPAEGANYWQAGAAEAVAFGRELRHLQPRAHLVVAPDARPWQVEKVPMAEFASFCDEIAPQAYWRLFDSPANHRKLAEYGFAAGPVTPELILDVTAHTFRGYGRPVSPIGQGDANADDWQRFMGSAVAGGSQALSVWRYGISEPSIWDLFGPGDEGLAIYRDRDIRPSDAVGKQASAAKAPPQNRPSDRSSWMRPAADERRGPWR